MWHILSASGGLHLTEYILVFSLFLHVSWFLILINYIYVNVFEKRDEP